MDVTWLKRRVEDFRTGHGMYTSLALSGMNTAILVSLKFDMPILYVIALSPLYFAVASLIGKLHRAHFLHVHMGMTRDRDLQFQELKKDVKEIKETVRRVERSAERPVGRVGPVGAAGEGGGRRGVGDD